MNKYIPLFILGISLAVGAQASATEANDGFYVQGNGSANWFENNNFDTGFGAGGALGYKFSTGTRFEGEYAFRRSKLDNDYISTFDLSDHVHVTQHAVMGNVYQDLNIFNGCLVPYVGGGAGYSFDKVSSHGVGVTVGDGWAWQAMGGFTCPIADKTELGVEYKYFDGVNAQTSHGAGVNLRRFF